MKKTLITILATVLVCACLVGGTLAWLMDTTDTLTNTFTIGDVDIDLKETTGEEYQMIPGNTIEKDPTITVSSDSEDCWLFVKVEKINDVDDFLTVTMDSNWKLLAGETNVYYIEAGAQANDSFSVFANDEIKVRTDVTKAQMDALTDATRPQLKITAYAIQKANIADVATAWSEIGA